MAPIPDRRQRPRSHPPEINLWLPKAVDDGHDLQAREQMAFGQYLAGMAFNSAGLGLVYALAHQPGATHNLPHGVCNAILLPIIENFNRPNARWRACPRGAGDGRRYSRHER